MNIQTIVQIIEKLRNQERKYSYVLIKHLNPYMKEIFKNNNYVLIFIKEIQKLCNVKTEIIIEEFIREINEINSYCKKFKRNKEKIRLSKKNIKLIISFIKNKNNEYTKRIWTYLIENYRLPEKLMEEHINEIPLDIVLTNQKLSLNFIKKHIDKFDTNTLIIYQHLDEEILSLVTNENNIHLISKHQNVSEEFIEKHIDKINLKTLPLNQKLSENFIRKYIDKLNIEYVLSTQNVSEKFIEDHCNKISNYGWFEISRNKNIQLSEDFIAKYRNKLHFDVLIKNHKLSEKILEENITKFKFSDILKYQKVSTNFIEKYNKKINWKIVLRYQNLSESFLEKHIDKICKTDFINYVFKYQKVSLSFIEKLQQKKYIDVDYIKKCQQKLSS